MTTETRLETTPHTDRGVTTVRAVPEKSGIVGAACDWVTATTPMDKVGYGWYDLFVRHGDVVGKKPEHWKNRWYDGARYDDLFWGYNKEWGYIFVASGSNAAVYSPMATMSANRVTRMDLQVTVRMSDAQEGYASDQYLRCLSGFERDRKYTLISNSDKGQTLYIGSRHSDQFGRLYDKGVQAEIEKPGHMWRFEVEFKKPRADSIAREIMACRETCGLDTGITAYLHQWFTMRGVRPLFTTEDQPFVIEVERKVTTEERKLAWLRTQVRPTVEKLFSMGLGDEVQEALGFTPFL